MKKISLILLLAAILYLSCYKVKVGTGSVTKARALTATVTCGGPIYPDTSAFAAGNKVADAPISPATGGTQLQNAQNNYEKIQYCLMRYGHSVLAGSAEFVLNHVLVMQDATLTSGSDNWLTLRAVATNSNSMIKMYGNSRVSFLTINANKNFLLQCNSSVVEVSGSGNKVDNNWIIGADTPLLMTDTGIIMGVVIFCGDDNLIQNNKIRNNHYGVLVLNSAAPGPNNNVIDGNEVFYNRCDGITMATYGQVTNNKIHHNGWDCRNYWNCTSPGTPYPSIPGAGIYSLANHYGSLIQHNTIYDNNGHNIDMDNVANMMILNNNLYNPGNMSFPETDYGTAPVYGAAFSLSLCEASDCTVQDDTVKNEARPTNAVGHTGPFPNDPNGIFHATGATDFTDLPFTDSSIIAFCLSERPSPTNQTAHNIINNNIFVASPHGIGYFSSRNTGFAADSTWTSSTTNYFTLNNPFGSTVGSVRCGGNWYAADSVHPNTDDYQHYPPIGNWAGNDFKYFY